MNYTVVSPWHPWFSNGTGVAGYATHYARGFSFVTVKGAGHQVAEYQPGAAWTMMHNFALNEAPL